MKGKTWYIALVAIALCISSAASALTKKVRVDAPEVQFILVENNADDNFFVTPEGTLNPRLTGASKWTGLKYAGGGGTHYQQSLGYADNGYNTPLTSGNSFDMWLEGAPIKHPFVGLRCINWYSGCSIDTSLIEPQATDEKGFYGAIVTSGGQKWMHGLLSPSFYQYLSQMPVGGRLTMEMNGCQTPAKYNAAAGERCQDQDTGAWYGRKITHVKAAQLRLMNTNAMTELFVNSDGVPIIGEGNNACKMMTIGTKSGVMCKMVDYTLDMVAGAGSKSIHIFPAIMNPALASAVSMRDVMFSLDGNKWRNTSGTTYYYTFEDLKESNAVYIFFSSNFFKQVILLGISDSDTRTLINFRFQNTISPESGWYEFSTSNQLIIKPRDFGISIISDDYNNAPKRHGHVGADELPLNFGYVVTTSGKTAADEVLVKVSGPGKEIGGRWYCIYSSEDGVAKVPFPAQLSFTTSAGGQRRFDAGCDDVWHDMTDALWGNTPWQDISGEGGVMNKTHLTFSIPMNAPVSQFTVDKSSWYGDVSASGEIHVKATWRNID